ncbi:hypothetical protein [uncultured Xylophilus sp.]|uniref:hypothetical protein n=1 Tax=uncultured Xylophilus sp. TaxID=296832 RepID=UPI0025F58A95|nr:hypothetical protein [uncultured Xylophilus sp.]
MSRLFGGLRRLSFILALLASACGGGSDSGSPSASTNITVVAPEVETVDALPPSLVPLAAQSTNEPMAATTPLITSSQLFSWVPVGYPQLFNGNYTEGVYSGISYRFFPSTGNFVGTLDGYVYAYGPATRNTIYRVGTLQGFNCAVMPEWCLPAGGQRSPSSITFNKSELVLVASRNTQESTTVKATITNIPNDLTNAIITISGKGFSNFATIYLGKNFDGEYSATFNSDYSLELGTYTGTMKLILCRNDPCTEVATLIGGELPYRVTIVPRVELTIAGNASQTTGTTYIRSGETVTITSNRPVTWRIGSSITGSTMTTTTSTPYTWTGVLKGSPQGFIGVFANPTDTLLGGTQALFGFK